MKRSIALLMTLCLLMSQWLAPAAAEPGRPEGDPWINCDIYGCWPSERPGPEEQFTLYANFDYFREVLARGEDATSNQYTRTYPLIMKCILEMCTDPGRTDAECESLRILYGYLTDRESIAAGGFASLMTYVDRIRGINTVDELTALMREEGFLFGKPFFDISLEYYRNTGTAYFISAVRRSVFSEIYPEGEEADAMPQKDTEDARRQLMRMGWSEEEAAGLTEKILWLEEHYFPEYGDSMPKDLPHFDRFNSAERIRELCPQMYAMLKGQGYVKEGAETEAVYEVNLSDLFAFRDLFTEENLETIKAVMALSLYQDAMSFLGREAFPEADEASGDLLDSLEALCRTLPPQAYAHNYIPKERIEVYDSLVEDIRQAMRTRIIESTWASPETKEKAIHKLDKMVNASLVYRWEFDFEPLRTGLRSCDNLLEAAAQCVLFSRKCDMDYAGVEAVPGDKYKMGGSFELSGKYAPDLNVFYMGLGAVTDGMYDDTSRETILGTLGCHIAHEISHGFDTTGMNYDADGEHNPIWSESDKQLYLDRANAISERAGRVRLLDDLYVLSGQQIGEIIADTEGVRLVLDLVKDEENFDYDAFFRAFARVYSWYFNNRAEYTAVYLDEVHPAPMFRVNFTVQMMDEFYETYPSVVEGTPMYLAPEERQTIW